MAQRKSEAATLPGTVPLTAAGRDSAFDFAAIEAALEPSPRSRWQPWQRRVLAASALLALLGIALLVRALVVTPTIDASWRAGTQGGLELVASPLPSLQPLVGARLIEIVDAGGNGIASDSLTTMSSPRWIVDDAHCEAWIESQQRLDAALRRGAVTLVFDGQRSVRIVPQERGLGGLGALFWLMGAVALSLVLFGVIVLLLRVRPRNLLYGVIALAQALNLLLIGVESLPGLGLPGGFAAHSLTLRGTLDLLTAAALLHMATLLPLRLPGGRWIAATGWGMAAMLAAALAAGRLAHAWWWIQAATLAAGIAAIVLFSWSYRIEPNPLAMLLRRLSTVGLGTLALLTLAIAVSAPAIGPVRGVAAAGTVIWYLFLASLLLLLPFMSRTQMLVREFAMLAGISTVAMSLNLLFVALFGLEQFASLSLAVFVALGIYAGTRRWLLAQIGGSNVLSAERMFERLYRGVREVEAHPQQSVELLTRMLRDVFEPLDVMHIERRPPHSRVVGDGAALLVPVPSIAAAREADAAGSIVLRFAGRGKRMFTSDDARLTDRVVEQLKRSVAYDQAVERARSEERTRIAQDLHDDIGARLLTLMYKAQTPEMEDYIRHTLKDLKTLTRGLAAAEHRLSYAAGEWKADITQRLTAAHIELSWSFELDHDVVLSVVQWSALTRVLRELVSNIIQHSCATHVDIAAALERGRLVLSLADDGIGRDPQHWTHGLGLGGVRKRVKLLGGDVQWKENGRAGIVCVVLVPDMRGRG